MSEISRRDFLSSSALLAIGGGLCASTFNIEALAAAPKTQRTVADILHMSDVQIAKESVVFVLNFQSNGISTVKTVQSGNANLGRTSERNICVKWPNVKIW